MVVDNLDVPTFAVTPHETDPPLIVDADTVLPFRVQRLQLIAGRDTQIIQSLGRVDGKQLGEGPLLDLQRQLANGVATEDRRRAFVDEALDHREP
jgi:hypothetical protein